MDMKRSSLNLAPMGLVRGPIVPQEQHLHPLRNGGDRKSTRLNSSHSQISYAVLCLKKTNIVQHPRGDEPEFLNTAFSVQAGRGMAIWLGAVLAAYPVPIFYNQPPLLPLHVLACLSQ